VEGNREGLHPAVDRNRLKKKKTKKKIIVQFSSEGRRKNVLLTNHHFEEFQTHSALVRCTPIAHMTSD